MVIRPFLVTSIGKSKLTYWRPMAVEIKLNNTFLDCKIMRPLYIQYTHSLLLVLEIKYYTSCSILHITSLYVVFAVGATRRHRNTMFVWGCSVLLNPERIPLKHGQCTELHNHIFKARAKVELLLKTHFDNRKSMRLNNIFYRAMIISIDVPFSARVIA